MRRWIILALRRSSKPGRGDPRPLRSSDQEFAVERLEARWEGITKTIRPFRQMSNNAELLSLPLVLPHWVGQEPAPYIYVVDSHRELEENAMWFAQRRTSSRRS